MSAPVFPDFSALLPAAVNHLLAQEAWARAALGKHAGQSARFDLGIVALDWQVTADGLLQAAESACVPAVVIRIRPADLPLIAQDMERAVSYVRIEGDAEFANTISMLTKNLKWEAEEDVSKLVGDIAAKRMVTGAKSALNTVRTTQQALAENLAEYFLEEKPLLMRTAPVADFGNDVTRLRDDLERLEKRIKKLEAQALPVSNTGNP
ncbi:MAG: sterol-binding protein [Proteobacteria bacterium]|nr:sterol-binding protein [Pseudomonadota bacterium]